MPPSPPAAADLASQFEQVHRDFIEEVERFTDDQWRVLVPGEDWTVGVVSHHVVDSFGLITGWIRSLADGGVAPYDHAEIDRVNAAHARQHASCTQAETATLARREGADAARLVARLTDAQLDTEGSFQGKPWTSEQMIRRVLIGHTGNHLASIRAALGAS